MFKFKKILVHLKVTMKRSFLSLFTLRSLVVLILWLILEVVALLLLHLYLKRRFIVAFESTQMFSISILLFLILYSNLDLGFRQRFLESKRISYNIAMGLDPNLNKYGEEQGLEGTVGYRLRSFFKSTRAAQLLVILISSILLFSTIYFY